MRTCLTGWNWLLRARKGKAAEKARRRLPRFRSQADRLEALLTSTEMTILLSGEADRMNAIMEIHPGAGGTEAQDWAEMLERHVSALGGRAGFQSLRAGQPAGEEAGIKSVTMRIEGENAYGLLQGEKGIHRLIRISPFDSSAAVTPPSLPWICCPMPGMKSPLRSGMPICASTCTGHPERADSM